MNKHLTKRLAVGLTAAAIALGAPLAALAGWAPDRPSKDFSKDKTGFGHVTFNSFYNTPNFGDERVFFIAKDAANQQAGGFSDPMTVTPGQEVMLKIYVHNGADEGLNASGAGIARNTKVRVFLPTGPAKDMQAIGYISADNANPGTISDTLNFKSGSDVTLDYVEGSARLNTNHFTGDGAVLSDDIVKGGATIGYDKLDGNMPGCFKYDAIVTLKVKVSTADFQFSKLVTTPGSTNWQPSMTAKEGDTVSWLLDYRNKSDVLLRNVIIKDQLPADLEVVPGSVMMIDGNFPNGHQLSDTALFNEGVNVGNIKERDGGGYIRFRTKLKTRAGTVCTPITNAATAKPEGLEAEKGQATVNVDKVCAQTPPPVTPPPTEQLPATGVEGAAAGVFGTGVLGYGMRGYLRSRRSLINALKR
jgi:uncharacterized repeat protein (TIGR01451 family)